jgi:hypothetical protein
VERIGRTSGIVDSKEGGSGLLGPADIVRFVCQSHPEEAERETTMSAGSLSNSNDADLLSCLERAREIRRR